MENTEGTPPINQEKPVSRRTFLKRAVIAVAGLFGAKKLATDRNLGGQLEPKNPSDDWKKQHGSPVEKAGVTINSLSISPAEEAKTIGNSPKQPSPDEKAEIMERLKKINSTK